MNRPEPVRQAMILAAGLGERMRPLTDSVPKPLLKLRGRSLIDHALDRIEEARVTTVIVNAFHLADQIDEHLSHRKSPTILVSREEHRLETGGGVLNALPLLKNEPLLVINGDAFWLNGPGNTLRRMQSLWNGQDMDALLLMHATVDAYGYDGRGDFVIEPDGVLTRCPDGAVCPHMFTGIQILHPRVFKAMEPGMFSLNVIYDQAIENSTLYGMVHDGEWFHIGTPQGLAEAEKFLAERYSGVKRR